MSERDVARHYGDSELAARVFEGIEKAGIDVTCLQVDDLSPVDEFHIGGRQATEYAIGKMSLGEQHHVLDVGCGLGGAARYLATTVGCRVTGIDLTPEYISLGRDLTERTGLCDRVKFEVGNALSMPFADDQFDAAVTFHAAMNISDRQSLYCETARVLVPDAEFCIFDVMKNSDEALQFPLPWADSAATSHLVTPDEMRDLLQGAGFEVRTVEDRTEVALAFFEQMSAAATGPPPLGLHLLLGPNTKEKVKNARENIEHGRIAPVLMLARLG